MSDIPTFGEKLEGVEYSPYRGAYAVIFDNEARNILVVNAKQVGLYLPGGGIEEREEPEEAVRREVYEETGFTVSQATFIGNTLTHLHFPTEERYAAKKDWYFRATLNPNVERSVSQDHESLWLPIEGFLATHTFEAQVWAIRQIVEN